MDKTDISGKFVQEMQKGTLDFVDLYEENGLSGPVRSGRGSQPGGCRCPGEQGRARMGGGFRGYWQGMAFAWRTAEKEDLNEHHSVCWRASQNL